MYVPVFHFTGHSIPRQKLVTTPPNGIVACLCLGSRREGPGRVCGSDRGNSFRVHVRRPAAVHATDTVSAPDNLVITDRGISAMESSTVAATTVAAIRDGQRNGTHRVVNAHGRLMYDEIVINDVWINAILSTLALSCAACVCLCFLYCKFQQWKRAGKHIIF